MQKFFTYLFYLIFLGLIAGIGYGLIYFLINAPTILSSLDKEVLAAIIATSGTILVAVGTIVYNQRIARQSQIAEAHRPEKIKVYKGFMKGVISLMRQAKGGKLGDDLQEGTSQELEKFFFSFTRDLTLWGAPNVIKAYKTFRDQAGKTSSASLLILVDNIFREIRTDLGHSNKGLQEGDLIKLFLQNPSEIDLVTQEKLPQ